MTDILLGAILIVCILISMQGNRLGRSLGEKVERWSLARARRRNG